MLFNDTGSIYLYRELLSLNLGIVGNYNIAGHYDTNVYFKTSTHAISGKSELIISEARKSSSLTYSGQVKLNKQSKVFVIGVALFSDLPTLVMHTIE